MKTTQKGFIAPLLLALVALLLLGGGAYVYQQTKQTSQPVASTTSTTQTSNSQNTTSSEDGITTIKYDQASPEQKSFLDKIVAQYSVVGFKKDKVVLFYFNLTKNVAIVGAASTADNLLVGFFHPVTSGGPAVAPQPFQEGPLSGVACKNASSFSASCIYVTKKYLVFFGGDDISTKGIFAYKAGDVSYNTSLQEKSWGSYIKEYDANYIPTLNTSFDGRTITASIYKDNQYIGMGEFDLTKKNEYVRTVTFELN